MTFAHPERLAIVLLLVAAFALVYRSIERGASQQAYVYSSLAFATAAMRPSRWPAVAVYAALLLGVAALTSALAAPRLLVRVPVKDGIVMLCIDTSGSMRATDLVPSRAEAARAAALTFLGAVPPGARIGIVSFASEAVLVQQPTADLDAARSALDRVPPPNGATAIGDALSLAVAQLPRRGTRAIVLLTDGVNNRGSDPVSAARQAALDGVTIHTVGVGTNGSGQLIPGTTEPADLDEETLRAIADLGHGTYVAAKDAGGLASAFRNLAGSTVWEARKVDGSTLFAASGGVMVIVAFLAGFAVGKWP
ncbi:MAG: VWA domain-containing protein [Candidatus Eremiobacteraeota bacterium]|nr:VWA domain-containing protein [Candidatus Eremiobacteraeota bacterium]MBV9646748.1 VWA domain-containing protein [Candidatus Eremiobacteraeota bacterium]